MTLKSVGSPLALRALERHPWPGNVRELENVIRAAHILCAGRAVIRAQDLTLESPRSAVPLAATRDTPARRLQDLERQQILAALERCGGRVCEAYQ